LIVLRRDYLLLLFVFVLGCAQRQAYFVVLPNADGTSGAITVSSGQQSVLLDKPYAASEEKSGNVTATTSDSQQVQQIFGSALAAQPILPNHFRLYFYRDTDVMTAESKKQYQSVFEDIKRRPVYQVEVIGYTDTLGTQAHNQQLSLKRAEAIRDLLIHDGLNGSSISVAGRGELDPAVPTAPQVSEPRNRRVEITVR
jgi:outer membrane protein OmpA-like peptidoglycan-associated protein